MILFLLLYYFVNQRLTSTKKYWEMLYYTYSKKDALLTKPPKLAIPKSF